MHGLLTTQATSFQPRSKPPTVDEAVDAYLQHLHTERRAAKTLEKYKTVLDRARELLRARRAASLLDLDLRAVDAYRHAYLYLSHHGGATCTEADPHCSVCPLLKECPEGARRTM